MHRWLTSLLAIALFFPSATEALLPPLYESIRELSAILASQELSNYLSAGEMIESIKQEEGGYRIDGSRSACFVKVIPIHNGKIGPLEFTLQFESIEPPGDATAPPLHKT